ncbi:unnamed protein product [Ilex paraguariensis]|uniref:Uncharacterized protein n=1 Tax=Ilex paraguariensis TaxID=185542 RepID=A0ABC8TKH4_9AQUA
MTQCFAKEDAFGPTTEEPISDPLIPGFHKSLYVSQRLVGFGVMKYMLPKPTSAWFQHNWCNEDSPFIGFCNSHLVSVITVSEDGTTSHTLYRASGDKL